MMGWPDETESTTGTTLGGTAWRRARVYPNSSDDRATVYAPASLMDGAPTRLVIATHGTGGSDATLDSGSGATVRDALLDAGYVIAIGNLHGNTWGNSVGMADLANLYGWCADLWDVTDTMFFGQSQGGGVVTVAARRKVIPTLRAVAAVAPAVNFQWVAQSGSSSAAILTAFDATLGTFAAKTADYAPFSGSAVDYAGMHFKLWVSPDDTTTPPTHHAVKIYDLGLTTRMASFEVVTVSGEHLSADHYRPAEVVSFYAAALTAGNVDPGARSTVRAWTGSEWELRTPRVWTGSEWQVSAPTVY